MAQFLKSFSSGPRLWKLTLLVAGGTVAGNTISIKEIHGRSMQPTFNPDSFIAHDLVLVIKTPALRNYNFKRGDIVSAWAPHNPELLVVKRILALAGDKVTYRSANGTQEMAIIPEGRVWIEGDEPFHTRDSKSYGPVPLGCLHGKVVCILYPFSRFGSPKAREYRESSIVPSMQE